MGASEMPRTLGCVLLLLYVEDQFCNRERPGAVDLRHLSTQHFAEKERNTQRTLSFQAQTTGDSIPNTTRAGRARAARCSLPTCPVGSWNRIRKAHRFLDPAGAPVAAALPVRAPRLLEAAAALRSPRLPCVPLPAICRSYTVNVGLRTAAVGTTRGRVSAFGLGRRPFGTGEPGPAGRHRQGSAPFAALPALPHVVHVGQAVARQELGACGSSNHSSAACVRSSGIHAGLARTGWLVGTHTSSAWHRQGKVVPIARA